MHFKVNTSHCICFQIADFKELGKAVKDAKSVVVVGGGFLGSELACALGHRGTCTCAATHFCFSLVKGDIAH